MQGLCITWTVSFYFCLSFWQAFQCFECSLHEEYNITTTIVLQEAASIVLFAVISVYCQQHENLFVFVLETLINLKRGGTYLKCAWFMLNCRVWRTRNFDVLWEFPQLFLAPPNFFRWRVISVGYFVNF